MPTSFALVILKNIFCEIGPELCFFIWDFAFGPCDHTNVTNTTYSTTNGDHV